MRGGHRHARIGRLVFGAEDAKGGAVVHGPRVFDQPTCHWRPKVEGGVLAEESSALLKGFFRARRKPIPIPLIPAKAGTQDRSEPGSQQ